MVVGENRLRDQGCNVVEHKVVNHSRSHKDKHPTKLYYVDHINARNMKNESSTKYEKRRRKLDARAIQI